MSYRRGPNGGTSEAILHEEVETFYYHYYDIQYVDASGPPNYATFGYTGALRELGFFNPSHFTPYGIYQGFQSSYYPLILGYAKEYGVDTWQK